MAVRGGRAFESTRGALAEDGEPVFQVLSVTPQETRVRFRLPTVEISETEVNGRSYSVVKAAEIGRAHV